MKATTKEGFLFLVRMKERMILRVKRARDDAPLESFVISAPSKKKKFRLLEEGCCSKRKGTVFELRQKRVCVKKAPNAVLNPQERRQDKRIFDAFHGENKLLEDDALVNYARSADGTTALMAAAWLGDEATVLGLLSRGALADSRDVRGNDAASLASSRGHESICKILSEAPNAEVVKAAKFEEDEDGFQYDFYHDDDNDDLSTRCVAAHFRVAQANFDDERLLDDDLSSLEDDDDSNAENHQSHDYPDEEEEEVLLSEEDDDDDETVGVPLSLQDTFRRHYYRET